MPPAYATPKLGQITCTTSADAPTAKPVLTRAESMAIGVYALEHHKSFAPGVYGHERTQAAESIMRVVLDALDSAKIVGGK
jgi:hypothetical protein